MPSAFPPHFFFGAATSAYQIEGAANEEGKGLSIWDTFCQKPGTIRDGSSGDKACDHYHRYQEDVMIMKDLNLNAYRFSISWPRIFPDSSLKLNQKGLDFYSRLIDALLEKGIEPFPTLYHWDLPQYLQDRGGWAVRETAERFLDYATAVYEDLSDRVTYWTTLNEPYISAIMGYLKGVHAPGHRSLDEALSAIHHLLLAHGMAVQRLRKAEHQWGIALNLSPAFPDDPESKESLAAAERYDLVHNRLFLDALFKKAYPLPIKACQPGDEEIIGAPLDFLGINYYTRTIVCPDPADPFFGSKVVPALPNRYSDLWEFYPEGLLQLLDTIHKSYKPKAILILENGTSLPDRHHDAMRIHYLEGHLEKVLEAIQKGIPVKGFFVWSLLDNFEWAAGYTKRFGLLDVDFKTFKRSPKLSAHWYAKFIKSHLA